MLVFIKKLLFTSSISSDLSSLFYEVTAIQTLEVSQLHSLVEDAIHCAGINDVKVLWMVWTLL